MTRLVDLARRFTVDWINSADESVPGQIMTSDYRVHVGDTTIDGLPAYVPAVLSQLRQFPGLTLTVHQLITDGEQLALVFTEHGASARHELRAAAWRGVALFAWDGERFTENWTQEDYAARHRQLADGVPDAVPAAEVSPWTTVAAAPDPAAEDVVRRWLRHAEPGVGPPGWEDGRGPWPSVGITEAQILAMFSAGTHVAYAATLHTPTARLGVAGVVTVTDGSVTGGTVVSDRLGHSRFTRCS